jgi:pSer/pThr/pTyr-binding forkhead associated (FHA) protein
MLKGARELIVEDLNSTNGVLLNGKKVSRHLVNDGDVLTIGEIQFRCVFKPAARPAEGAPEVGHPGVAIPAPSAPARVSDLRQAEPSAADPQSPRTG